MLMIIEREYRDERIDRKEVAAGIYCHEYQTASYFEVMSRDHSCYVNSTNDGPLIAQDLVVLYKNIDKGNQLLPNAETLMPKKPNQYVETIVHSDDQESENSEISDVNSTEELQSLFAIDDERIGFFSNRLPLDNKLCQKFGGINIQSSNVSTEYNKTFRFQDPYIKNQLNTFNVGVGVCQFEGSLLPTSLLDYICCKRLEDNYNFYMDNVITYVKHTIEQLKRISNGEYLTDRTREKWKEVKNSGINKCAKILATSTSIPLHIESKSNGRVSTWNDLVHSDIDIRYLSKVLEKQIVLEVPKLICCSYKLFSKRYADNLIISCKQDKPNAMEINDQKENTSRVDLVFRFKKSQSGHMMGNINSIIVVQTPTNAIENYTKALLPLPYKELENIEATDKNIEITEMYKDEQDNVDIEATTTGDAAESKDTYFGDYETQCESIVGTNDYPNSDNDCYVTEIHDDIASSDSDEIVKKSLHNEPLCPKESACHDIKTSDDIRLTLKRLNRKLYPSEEIGEDVIPWIHPVSKKKSPTRVRIKSPYENRSYILEEKKRKRLLEIREKREKKKLAMGESCKISRTKYPNGGVVPQPSSSVTKLSITNKSFYDSIYGHATPIESKHGKLKNCTGVKKDSIAEVPLDEIRAEDESLSLTVDRNNEMSAHRHHYLDDAITEVMYMKMKKKEICEARGCSASTSVVSSDFRDNLKLLSQVIGPSTIALHKEDITSDDTSTINEMLIIEDKHFQPNVDNPTSNFDNKAPANNPINATTDNNKNRKETISSIECRKSIDKIYDLLQNGGKNRYNEKLLTENKPILPQNGLYGQANSTLQGSDSGTSIKHHLTSSNPSFLSFGITNEVKPNVPPVKNSQTPIVPKVIINTKPQNLKFDNETSKKIKKVAWNTSKASENPLRAISQLLHDIDNVQKTRNKPVDQKFVKKSEPVPCDVKSGSRQSTAKRRSRFDQHTKDYQLQDKKNVNIAPPKLKYIFDVAKTQNPLNPCGTEKKNQEVIIDNLDDEKEARGEAVRGPPKLYSRLNSLAQPKRTYVQAHSEEYHTKYGKNLMTDRLQRLATTKPISLERKLGYVNSKIKKGGIDSTTPVSLKLNPMPTTAGNERRSASISPKGKVPSLVLSSKYKNIPETHETKKIEPLETYVKDNYGRASLTNEVNEILPLEQISRVPLLPNDIDLMSVASTNTAEESNELGNKLHCIIDTMLNTKVSHLAVLSECVQTNAKSRTTEEFSLINSLSGNNELVGEEFDFPLDIFEDKNIITAVAVDNKNDKDMIKGTVNCNHPEGQNLTNEMAKLENALCRQTPVGMFQNRLRNKNLTLTPKHSIQTSYLLQSGDTGSYILNNTLSQNFITYNRDKLADLITLPVLSKSDLDWSLVKFPMQMVTVGYAFQKYPELNCDCNSKSKSICHKVDCTIKSAHINSSVQCGQSTNDPDIGQEKFKIEQNIQVDLIEKPAIDNAQCNLTREVSKASNDEKFHSDVSELKSELTQLVCDEEMKQPNKTDMSIDYTTSLDMLAGLLNEIHKITTCQSHITKVDRIRDQNKELEIIMNGTGALRKSSNDNSRELVPFTSLDKLRQVEINPSIYTIYLSSDEVNNNCVCRSKQQNIYKPIYEDKEVFADFVDRETVNRFTEVPSIFPITVNHSTNVTNSLIGVLSEPSSQSLFSSYIEYKSIYSDIPLNPRKKIMELSLATSHDESSLHSLVPNGEQLEAKETIQLKAITDSSQGQDNKLRVISYRNLGYSNYDYPSIKIKRDILVTVYSILVVTVFAALSFPQIIYSV